MNRKKWMLKILSWKIEWAWHAVRHHRRKMKKLTERHVNEHSLQFRLEESILNQFANKASAHQYFYNKSAGITRTSLEFDRDEECEKILL